MATAGTESSRRVERRPFGSFLLGRADEQPRAMRVRVQILLTTMLLTVNVAGTTVAVVLLTFVLAEPAGGRARLAAAISVPTYLVIALVVAVIAGTRTTLRGTRWMRGDRPPTPEERRRTLRLPLRLTAIQAALWGVAVVLFTVLFGVLEPSSIDEVLSTVLFSGVITCAFAYLLAEFAMRPVAARALEPHEGESDRGGHALADHPRAASLRTRTVLFWAVGSGLPVLGLVLAAGSALVGIDDLSVTRLAVVVIVLAGTTLVVGFLLTFVAAAAVVAPVRLVRDAMADVGEGRLDTRIPVYDGTEIGLLQDGFNQMAAGLRERERIRELFGRYVGREVAAEAIGRSATLGGEERFVAVLFADLVGSTALAVERPPGEVVDLLNRFFTIVVDEIDAHDGFVNKFEGDAVLAVFGAPLEHEDGCGAALAAARGIAGRIAEERSELTVGIGVSAGVAVAGTVGDERRLEYTVIGDPVNEAARLTELAKSLPGGVAASMATVEAAAAGEAARWTPGDEFDFRGRPTPTRIATPA